MMWGVGGVVDDLLLIAWRHLVRLPPLSAVHINMWCDDDEGRNAVRIQRKGRSEDIVVEVLENDVGEK